MKTKQPSKKILNRKIVVDDVGTTYTVGKLSKEDLQILVCALADDLDELKENSIIPCPVCGLGLREGRCPANCQDDIY